MGNRQFVILARTDAVSAVERRRRPAVSGWRLSARGAHGYVELQRQEWSEDLDLPTRSHHLFSGVPYHHRMSEVNGAARLSRDVHEELREAAAL